jgi:hypothetical protein
VTVDLRAPREFEMPAAARSALRERLLREARESEAGRLAGAQRRRLRSRYHGRRTLALAGLLVAVTAVAAGAATGVLPIGSELSPERVPGEGEPRYTSQRLVVATGATSNGLDWRMTIARTSNQGFCLGLTLLDSVVGDDGFEACARSSTFDALGLGGGDALPDTTLVFGPVPEQAAAVRITAAGGFVRSAAELEDGSDSVRGGFYLAESPRSLDNVVVRWVTADGEVKEPGAFVESTIEYTTPPTGRRPY